MIQKDNFVEMISIDLIDNDSEYDGQYGHYPFMLHAVTQEDKMEVNAIATGIHQWIDRIRHYRTENAKQIYVTQDKPSNEHVDTDYIACYFFDGDEVSAWIMPYNTETGEIAEVIKEGDYCNELAEQIKNATKPLVTIIVKEDK